MQYLPEHEVGTVGHLLAPEAQDAIPESFEHQRAIGGVLGLEGPVLRHELDDDGLFGAEVVDDERPDGCAAEEAVRFAGRAGRAQ